MENVTQTIITNYTSRDEVQTFITDWQIKGGKR